MAQLVGLRVPSAIISAGLRSHVTGLIYCHVSNYHSPLQLSFKVLSLLSSLVYQACGLYTLYRDICNFSAGESCVSPAHASRDGKGEAKSNVFIYFSCVVMAVRVYLVPRRFKPIASAFIQSEFWKLFSLLHFCYVLRCTCCIVCEYLHVIPRIRGDQLDNVTDK